MNCKRYTPARTSRARTIVLAMVFLAACSGSFAQWEDISPQSIDRTNIIFFGARFYNADVGLAVGQDIASSEGIIARTMDGGSSWTVLSSPNAHLRAVDFFGENEALVMGYDGPPGNKTLLFLSDNQGGDWQPAELEAIKGINEMDAAGQNSAFAMGYGSVFGFTGSLLKTEDGGMTWSVKLHQADIYLAGMSVVDEQTVYIGATDFVTGYVYKTNDGGETWRQFEFEEWTEDVWFVNANVGYVLAETSLYKTSDGGETWQQSTVDESLLRIAFPTAERGYAVGEGGQALVTQDGAESWTPIQTGIQASLEHLTITGNWLYAAGRNGSVLRLDHTKQTEDGARISSDQPNQRLDYGTANPTGQANSKSLRIRNTGNAELRITDIIVDSQTPDVFALAQRPNLPRTLDPGQELELTVAFTPAEAGQEYSGSLKVTSNAVNAAEFVVELIGRADVESSVEAPGSGNAGDFISMHISPAPMPESGHVHYTLHTEREHVLELELADITGRHRQRLLRAVHGPGTYSLPFDARRYAPGTWFILASLNGQRTVLPFVIVR